MTSTLRYPATVTPASSLQTRLLTEAGRIALQYTPPLQGMVHELLETVVPILIAAATGTTIPTDRATTRIRVLTAQIAGSPAGIEPVARKINDLTSHLLHIVMTDDDPALRTVARSVSTAGN